MPLPPLPCIKVGRRVSVDGTEGGLDASAPAGEITRLLARWSQGDAAALDAVVSLVYAELRRIAAQSMRDERADHTLQATALVHEAFLRLARTAHVEVHDREHFYALVARTMRRVLVDHYREVVAARRGGGAPHVALEQAAEARAGRLDDLLGLDDALAQLERLDRRKARVIELRFFAGLDVRETARALSVSVPTIVSDTRVARAWLISWLDERSA